MQRFGSRGIALIIVLWVIALLMVIVFSFSTLSRTETTSALGFREMIEKKNLAEAGLERGIFEIVFRKQKTRPIGEEAWRPDGTPYILPLGSGNVSVRTIEESGKIDINMLTDASGILLKNLLVQRGVAEEDADTIVDSLLDWKDSGDSDAHRLHGAESDYYQTLPAPYPAKNANFDTVEELLLVKGMTPGILFGDREKKGIAGLLTVHARTGKINVNSAPKEVLAAIPGIGPELADTLVSERTSRETLSIADIQALLGQNKASAEPFITATETNTFTIEASGYKEREQAAYGIRATVSFADMNRYRYVFYKGPVTITP
jgi:general secretion pathway protein K